LKNPAESIGSPGRAEYLVLWLLTLGCGVSILFYVFFGLELPFEWGTIGGLAYRLPIQKFDPIWAFVFVLSTGLVAGTIYRHYRGWRGEVTPQGGLPVEGVMLCVMLASCMLLVAGKSSRAGALQAGEVAPAPGQPVARLLVKGTDAELQLNRFESFYGIEVAYGMVASSPLVVGDHIYVGVAEVDQADQSKGRGSVVCLDRHTKRVVWCFNDKGPMDTGKMQPVFSSPRIEDGRLYIGEGFHYNPRCKLYCLDAKTGAKLWEFATDSQVEGTPCIADGKVFIGGGNDGLYALDAKTGEKLWQYGPFTPIFRVGAGAAAANGKVYVGSGDDRVNDGKCETAVVCLDANTGKEDWKVRVHVNGNENARLPCWAAPVVAGDVIFFALGTGDLNEDAVGSQLPGGAVLCLEARTGKQRWRFDVPDSPIHTRPAVDGQSVYVGSRNGFCYCLNRFDGTQRWKSNNLGSPIFASPALDQGELTGRAIHLFVVAMGDMRADLPAAAYCLDAHTGEIRWSHAMDKLDFFLASSPTIVTTPTADGIRRQIYFGGWRKPPVNEAYLICLEDIVTFPSVSAADNADNTDKTQVSGQ
jgi:outer membrane protein assembly factor BamB